VVLVVRVVEVGVGAETAANLHRHGLERWLDRRGEAEAVILRPGAGRVASAHALLDAGTGLDGDGVAVVEVANLVRQPHIAPLSDCAAQSTPVTSLEAAYLR